MYDEVPNHHDLDLYAVGEELETAMQPFVHEVELEDKKGIMSKIEGLFDDGAMVNSICKSTFAVLQNKLGPLTPSLKTLWMADGTHIALNGSGQEMST